MEKPKHYRPEIDGLRAIAVLGVIFFHAEIGGLTGGFVGVDVFFVISGFLITSILVREFEKDKFSFANFWKRRIKRILPASVLVIIAIFILGFILMPPLRFRDLGYSIFAQSLFSVNIYFWADTGYFSDSALAKPMLHMWSLAIEEQFYLFYPLLLYFAMKRSKDFLLKLLIILTTVSFLVNVVYVFIDQNTTFYMLPFRAWELSIGGIFACLKVDEKLSRFKCETLSVLGLFLIIYPMWTFNSATPFPGFLAGIPVFGTVMFIYGNQGEITRTGKILSSKILVGIGLISYSLYLWHWPVLSTLFLMDMFQFWNIRLLSIPIMFLLSYFSYRLVEQYFRDKSRFNNLKVVYGSFAGATILVIALGLSTALSDGYMIRFDKDFQIAAYEAEIFENMEDPNELRFYEYGKLCDTDKLLLVESPEPSYDFVVLGDSHSEMLRNVIDELACENNLTGLDFTMSGHLPIPNLFRAHDQNLNDFILKRNQEILEIIINSDIENIFLFARWAAYTDGDVNMETDQLWGEGGKYATIVTNEKVIPDNITDGTEALREELINFSKVLQDNGRNVWIMQQVPETNVRHAIQEYLNSKRYPDLYDYPQVTIHRDEYLERQKNPISIFEDLKSIGVNIIDPTDQFFNEDDRLVVYDEENSYYRDDDHVSRYGAEKLVKPVLAPSFEALGDEKLESESNE